MSDVNFYQIFINRPDCCLLVEMIEALGAKGHLCAVAGHERAPQIFRSYMSYDFDSVDLLICS